MSRGPRTSRWLVAAVTAGLVAGAMALAASPVAAEYARAGEPVWLGRDAAAGAGRPDLRTVTTIGDVAYVGGNVTEWLPEEGVSGVAQPWLAAFDAHSGVLLPTFSPRLDGPVYGLESSADGRTLYVGGAFTTVDGQPQQGFVALDATTGRPRAGVTQRAVKGEVRTLTRRDGQLYLGGNFSKVGPTRRLDAARLDVSTPKQNLDPAWHPEFAGIVHSLVVTPDGTRVYAGGHYTKVDGVTRPRLVALDPASGAVITSFVASIPSRQPVLDVDATDTAVFAAIAGGSNRFSQLDRTGRQLYASCGDGDVQDVEVVGQHVLVGGHFTGAYRSCGLPNIPTARLGVYDLSTGVARPVTSPLPDIAEALLGVWDVHGTSIGDLWVVGDFLRAGNRAVGGLAHLADPAAYVDTEDPTTPGRPAITAASPGGVTLEWAPSTDDRVVAGYAVFVDGARYATAVEPAVTLAGLESTRTYRVQVQAFDAAMNRSKLSDEVEAAPVPDSGPPQAPTALRVTGGSPSSLTIAWDPAVDDGTVVRYDVVLDGTAVGSTTSPTFSRTGLQADRQYRFEVTATDAVGNVSPRSAVLVGRTYTQVMATGSTWRYWDQGALEDFEWRNAAYDDTTWASGPAPLGYGETYIATTVGYGPSATQKHLTTYARGSFTLADPTGITGLTLRMRADDGAAVFINGRLAYNDNIYAALEPDMTALKDRSGTAETWREFPVSVLPGMLVAGTNVVAVEIHQSSASSDDLSFDASISAGLPPVVDSAEPTRPGNPRITTLTSSTADLAWDPSTDDVRVDGYEVLVDGNVVATTTATSATVSFPSSGAATTLTVRAVDWSANRSASSDPIVVRASGATLVPAKSTWRYWDKGGRPTGWATPSFDDRTWSSGRAELGYGDGGEATVVSYGSSSSNKYITTYFRAAFTVADPASVGALNLSMLLDDGAAVYLNGQEIARRNLPSGTLSSSSLAPTAISGTDETTYTSTPVTVPAGLLTAGTNTLAVEVHQSSASSSDLSFDLELRAGSSWVRDAAAPSAPEGLTVTDVTTSTVALAWLPATDDHQVTGYEVHRDGVPVATTTDTAATITGLPDGTTATYTVTALDWVGRSSAPSVPVTATTVDVTAPSDPGSPSITAVGPDSVTLTWAASADNLGVAGYEVERDGTVVATTTEPSYTDAGLTELTTFTYRVRASDAAANTSGWSTPAPATTGESVPPTAPGAPVLTSRTATSVTLTWDAASDNVAVAGYRVQRDGADVATTGETTFTDTGLAPSTEVHYTVVALDTSGNVSPTSEPLTTTTMLAPDTTLLPFGATWDYTDTKVDLGDTWRDPAYEPTAPLWKQGAGQLGYGDGDEATVLNGGGATPDASLFTYYFRTALDVADPTLLAGLRLELIRDDGAAVYVNGVEVARTNLPDGPLTHTTKALASIGGADEGTPVVLDLPADLLQPGRNVIAVEVHNLGQANIDASFDLRISAR